VDEATVRNLSVSTRVWAAIVVASIGWGLGGVATRAAFDEGLGPFTITAMRAVIAAAAVFSYSLVRGRGLPRERRLWKLGLLLGTTNMWAPFILMTLAVQHASAGFVGLLIANMPIATAVWAHLLLDDEPLHRGKALGLGIASTGVVVLMASGDTGLGDEGKPLLAIGLSLAAIVSASFGAVTARRHAPNLHVLDLAGPQFAVGAVVMVVLMGVIEGAPTEATAAGWGLIAFMALGSTFLPFVLFYWMLQRVTSTVAMLIGYVVPVVSLVAGAILLDERVTKGIAIGGGLILAGVVTTSRAEAVRAPPAAGVVRPDRPGD
jgi:drug/metabolite transporter (DMT)-like permease